MNNLCTDIGYNSLNKNGEELCGDHVEVIEKSDGSMVVVLADGLGSGVKASILSTLTSKIISTMMAAGLSIEDCVSTIALTLPVCSVRGVAYSTFTIINIINGEKAEIIQFDNPETIFLRGGMSIAYPMEKLIISGKTVYKSVIPIEEGDVFLAISDGVQHAGIGMTLNFGWQRKDIVKYVTPVSDVGLTAKALSTLLLDECNRLYGGAPGDDTTVCAVRIRRREPMNLVIGPPSSPDCCEEMMNRFFSQEGRHIVCGGTTSGIAADYLQRPLIPSLQYFDKEIPPTAKLEGAELVTEGIITINKVLTYARDYLLDNETYKEWTHKKDGASCIARLLFEDATDISFFVGMAVNPAHQNPNLPINFSIKMRLVDELAECLKRMGKKIRITYF